MGFVAAYFLLDLLGLCTSGRRTSAPTSRGPARSDLQARLGYGVMAARFLVPLMLIRTLGHLGLSQTALLDVAPIGAFCFHHVRVTRQIAMV